VKAKNLKKWESELNVCIRCAYCFEGCPVYKELGWESDGARGKVILSYGLFSGELEPSKYIADKIYECTFCKDCVKRCSADVNVPDILSAARADLVENGFRYEEHEELLEKIEATGNIFGMELEAPAEEGEIPVLLGCRFLERKEDAKRYIEILEGLGIKPLVVKDEVCCGMPQGVLGYKDRLKEQMDTFRKRFPYKDFICMCTTCVFFISKVYPDLNPIYIIEEIYKRLPASNPKKLGISVTYHDPCNVSRGMDMVREPREILDWIGVELVEMEKHGKEAFCCGGGGGVLVTNKGLSEKLAKTRYQQAIDTEVDTLVTLCPTCEFNLLNASESNEGKMKVINLLDLIWEALR